MSNKSKNGNSRLKVYKSIVMKKRFIVGLFAIIFLVILAAVVYLLILRPNNNDTKDVSTTGKYLSIKDLENPNVDITPETSDASVRNLTKELKSKIDKQIAAKENPIDTVKELSGVLSNTTNQKRQDQLTDFLEDFLANHEDTLWFENEYKTPDQAQVNYWKGELYAYLVYNFQHLMENKFTDVDGNPVDTNKQQLKYIDLYLALANDPKSNIVIPEADREFLTGYEYTGTKFFLEIKYELEART